MSTNPLGTYTGSPSEFSQNPKKRSHSQSTDTANSLSNRIYSPTEVALSQAKVAPQNVASTTQLEKTTLTFLRNPEKQEIQVCLENARQKITSPVFSFNSQSGQSLEKFYEITLKFQNGDPLDPEEFAHLKQICYFESNDGNIGLSHRYLLLFHSKGDEYYTRYVIREYFTSKKQSKQTSTTIEEIGKDLQLNHTNCQRFLGLFKLQSLEKARSVLSLITVAVTNLAVFLNEQGTIALAWKNGIRTSPSNHQLYIPFLVAVTKLKIPHVTTSSLKLDPEGFLCSLPGTQDKVRISPFYLMLYQKDGVQLLLEYKKSREMIGEDVSPILQSLVDTHKLLMNIPNFERPLTFEEAVSKLTSHPTTHSFDIVQQTNDSYEGKLRLNGKIVAKSESPGLKTLYGILHAETDVHFGGLSDTRIHLTTNDNISFTLEGFLLLFFAENGYDLFEQYFKRVLNGPGRSHSKAVVIQDFIKKLNALYSKTAITGENFTLSALEQARTYLENLLLQEPGLYDG